MNEVLNNIFNSWKKSYLNHIFIENRKNKNITINNSIRDDIMHKTYYFEKSNNLIININTKINHLIINKCDNIILNINSSLISGLDIFHSNNVIINNNFEIQSNYSINFGQNFVINVNKISDIMNITLCVNIIYSLKINKLYNKLYIKFISCLNLFRIEPIYFFIDNSLERINGFDTTYGNFNIEKIQY